MEVATYPYYTLPSNGLYEIEIHAGDHVYKGSALVYSNKVKLQVNGYLKNIKKLTIKLKWMRCLENIQFKQMKINRNTDELIVKNKRVLVEKYRIIKLVGFIYFHQKSLSIHSTRWREYVCLQ